MVIPVHNEAEVLPALRGRLAEALGRTGLPFELVFVDDCSRDETFRLLQELHAADPRVKAVSFTNNFGHQTAVTAGLHFARGDAVVVMDGDLQDPPEVIETFLARWREGCDVVFGIRTKRKEGPLKRACYWLYYRILRKLSHIEIPADSGDFCLMDRKVVDLLNRMPERHRFIRGLRSWAGYRQVGIPYERDARYAGESKYSFMRLFNLGMDGIVSFSGTPLRASIFAGFLTSLASVAFAFYMLLDRIFVLHPGWQRTPGWTTLVAAVTFLGGIQLIVLGLVGEYLLRIYDEVKGRPHYVIRELVGLEESDGQGLRHHPGLQR